MGVGASKPDAEAVAPERRRRLAEDDVRDVAAPRALAALPRQRGREQRRLAPRAQPPRLEPVDDSKADVVDAGQLEAAYGDSAPRVWPGPSRAAAVARRLSVAPADDGAFDVALVADMIYLHDLHAGLVDTLAGVLKPGGAAYVTFMHRFEGKEHGDLRFFDLARDAGLDSECLETHTMPREQAVGAEPPGTPAPVFLYRLTKREVT